MKNKTFKKLLCLSLSATLLAGEPMAAIAAETAEPQEAVAAEQTEETVEESEAVEAEAPETVVTVDEEQTSEPETAEAEEAVDEVEVVEPEAEAPAEETAAPEKVTKNTGLSSDKKVVGKKIVTFTTLDPVSGIAYDAEEHRIYWNKVKNATEYRYQITNVATGMVVSTSSTSSCYTYFSMPGNYSISIVAVDQNEYYLAGPNIPSANWSEWEEDDGAYTEFAQEYANQKKYAAYVPFDGADGASYRNYFAYPKSAPVTAGFGVAEEPQDLSQTTKSTIGALSYYETTPYSIVFRVNRPKLMNGESIRWEYANNANFTTDAEKGLFSGKSISDSYDENSDLTYSELSLSSSRFSMGDTVYVRARMYSGNYTPAGYENLENRWENDEISYEQYQTMKKQLEAARYGEYVGITHKIPVSKVTAVNTIVTSSTVTLIPEMDGSVTGYEFAKKVNGKWSTLAKQTDPNYQDKGLSSKKTYEYRVRGYQYNKQTKKTTTTSWKSVKATTWGSSLKLKAAAASSKSVKLTWKKVSGAEGYEIYRTETSSLGRNATEGVYDDSFDAETLVKTIKKQKTTSYTDKKLTSGATYIYTVRAYRTVGKTKNYIEEWKTVRLQPENAANNFQTTSYYTNKGQLKVTWDKISGLKGYKVERRDPKTDAFVAYKTLKSSATSITFPKVAPGNQGVTYRIRPYVSNKVYNGRQFMASAALATVSNVKATATSTGIKVSWKAVPGADYYKVFRTTNPNYTYDKTGKIYYYYDDEETAETVYESALDTTGLTNGYDAKGNYEGYNRVGSYQNSEITATSVVDQTLIYQEEARDANDEKIQIGATPAGVPIYQTINCVYNQGPEKGVKYYYYVKAYADAPNGAVTSASCVSNASKTASATFTTAKPAKVKKITSLKSSKKGQATIKYSKVSKASGYVIYRATSKKGTYVPIARTSKTSFTDKGLSSKKTYYYKVASYKTTEAKSYVDSGMSGYKKVKIK